MGERPEGRPRKTYMDGIEEITRKIGTEESTLRKIAGDRRGCRRWILAVTVL